MDTIVSALKAHFPECSHPALGRKQGDAKELKDMLQRLLRGGDGGQQAVAAGGGRVPTPRWVPTINCAEM